MRRQVVDSVVCVHGWCCGWARESGVFILCDSCYRFFADIFFYINYIPRSTSYYFEQQIKNLMVIMSLCWELLMGWRTSWLGLKLLRACRMILLCRPAESLSNCHNNVPKLGNFVDIFETHNSFILVLGGFCGTLYQIIIPVVLMLLITTNAQPWAWQIRIRINFRSLYIR